MANKGQENLIPFNERTEEEQREIAKMGGIASGEARREKATMRKTLEAMLKQKNDKGITYQELSTLGLIKGAVNGKAENYKVMLQLLGELEEQEQVGTPQVNINIVDHTELEKALFEDETNED